MKYKHSVEFNIISFNLSNLLMYLLILSILFSSCGNITLYLALNKANPLSQV
jgi:hypothetical protein